MPDDFLKASDPSWPDGLSGEVPRTSVASPVPTESLKEAAERQECERNDWGSGGQ